MITSGEAIYYFEYLDNGLVKDLEKLKEKPLMLWTVGKIFLEDENYLAILCSGTRNREPNSKPSYEVILKTTITKKELIYCVE